MGTKQKNDGGRDVSAEYLEAMHRGDQKAFHALYTLYRPLVISMAAKFEAAAADGFCLSGTSDLFEELEQEAVIALYRAAETYHREQGVTFGLYARICIRNALVSFVRKNGRLSIPCVIAQPDEISDPAQSILEQDMMQCVMRQLQRQLKPEEMRIFRLYLNGNTYEQIAAIAGTSAKRVDNILYRVKKQIKYIAGQYGV